MSDFARRNLDRFVIHFLVFIFFTGILFFFSRRAKPWIEKEPELKQAAIIFRLPVATALILAILVSSWIYPQTPQILGAIFGAIALVPTIIILRKLVERTLYPLLYSLVVFYFIDQLRAVVEPVAAYSRLLLLAEMLGGFAFFLWLLFGRFSKDETEKIVHGKIFRTIKIAAFVALPIFAVSFLANAFGYVTLARLAGNAVLRSAYAAVVLYAAVRIIDGLIIFALRFRPLKFARNGAEQSRFDSTPAAQISAFSRVSGVAARDARSVVGARTAFRLGQKRFDREFNIGFAQSFARRRFAVYRYRLGGVFAREIYQFCSQRRRLPALFARTRHSLRDFDGAALRYSAHRVLFRRRRRRFRSDEIYRSGRARSASASVSVCRTSSTISSPA